MAGRLSLLICMMLTVGCGEGSDGACRLEPRYVCLESACYCIEDTLRRFPLSEAEARQQCEMCIEAGPITPSADAGGASPGSYDRFGGVDDFGGDDRWGY